jgi:hypothetical protein
VSGAGSTVSPAPGAELSATGADSTPLGLSAGEAAAETSSVEVAGSVAISWSVVSRAAGSSATATAATGFSDA